MYNALVCWLANGVVVGVCVPHTTLLQLLVGAWGGGGHQHTMCHVYVQYIVFVSFTCSLITLHQRWNSIVISYWII